MLSDMKYCILKTIRIKKVLLRERKRHTARLVASAHHAGLSPDGEGGIPHPVLDRGYPIQSQWELPQGTPILILDWVPSHPDLGWGTPISRIGYSPILILDGVPPYQQDGVTPILILDGYPSPIIRIGCPPISRVGYPPPDLEWGISCLDLKQGTPPIPTWDGYLHQPDGLPTTPIEV